MSLFSFLILCLYSTMPALARDHCLDHGKIRYHAGGKSITEQTAYCFDEERQHLYSKNCQSLTKPCIAKQQAKKAVNVGELFGPIGSPGFKLCFAYKGKPQIIEFYDGKLWIKLNRCSFPEDASFLDTDSLFLLRRATK